MNWRDELYDANKSHEKVGERQARNAPKYKVGDRVQTNFTAWPDNTMTEHTVERVWSCADGYLGASDYGYHLTPRPRGSNHRHIDELWLSPINNSSTKPSK